jgi:hypothetical protein
MRGTILSLIAGFVAGDLLGMPGAFADMPAAGEVCIGQFRAGNNYGANVVEFSMESGMLMIDRYRWRTQQGYQDAAADVTTPIILSNYEHVEKVPIQIGSFTHDDVQWTMHSTGKHELWGVYAQKKLKTVVDITREFGPSTPESKTSLICGSRTIVAN